MHPLNEWRLQSCNVNERTYEIVNKTPQIRATFPFESLTAFPNFSNYQSEETPSDGDRLAIENSEFRQQLCNPKCTDGPTFEKRSTRDLSIDASRREGAVETKIFDIFSDCKNKRPTAYRVYRRIENCN